jgi:chromosome segregation ATPase
MRRKFILAFLPLLLAGCLTPFTSRLDLANERAEAIHQQLVLATAKLDEATRTLERSEAKLDEASRTLSRMEGKLNDMDKKFTTVETGFKKLLGIKGPQEE